MSAPEISVIVPTRNRSELLPRALASALAQEGAGLEVVVVDDASEPAAVVPDDPRVRRVRLEERAGSGGARNVGLRESRGRWVTFLDDDDELAPGALEAALDAASTSDLPAPVAVLSALVPVRPDGSVGAPLLPPTLPRGRHFSLEPPQEGRSFFTKNTLVVEREVLLGIGGFDAELSSRLLTDLFLRLNPVCSLQGIDRIGYRLHQHEGYRISRDPELRVSGLEDLEAKHADLLAAHPRGYAELLNLQFGKALQAGLLREARRAVERARQLDAGTRPRNQGWPDRHDPDDPPERTRQP